MTYQLKPDEILEALARMDHPRAAFHRSCLETVATAAAHDLAEALGVQCGEATFEGLAFAGTCVPFWPATPDQPCPAQIEAFDAPASDNWESRP